MADLAPDLQIVLERVISAPHDARIAISNLLGRAANDEFWNNALLATSEVVTHSLTYAAGDCRLSAWHSPKSGWLRVEVTDGGGEMPSPVGDSGHPEIGGHRIAVLLQIPSAWGIEQSPFGRMVWFEVQREPEGADTADDKTSTD